MRTNILCDASWCQLLSSIVSCERYSMLILGQFLPNLGWYFIERGLNKTRERISYIDAVEENIMCPYDICSIYESSQNSDAMYDNTKFKEFSKIVLMSSFSFV